MTMIRRRHNQSGFTLTELIAVSAIIALFASLSAGYGIKRYQSRSLESNAQRVFNAARYARTLAIGRKEPCKLVVDQTQNRLYLYLTAINPQTRQAEQSIVQDRFCQPVTLPESIRFSAVQILSVEQSTLYDNTEASAEVTPSEGGSQTITFLPNGAADAGIITLTSGTKSFTLTIQPVSGRARLHNGTMAEIEQTTTDLDKQWQ